MTQFSKASLSRHKNAEVSIKMYGSIVMVIVVLFMFYDGSDNENDSHHLHHGDQHLMVRFRHGIFRSKDHDSKRLSNGLKNHQPFPPSIMEDEYEEIVHPASLFMDNDENQKNRIMLRVPKFWNPSMAEDGLNIRAYLGNYGQRRMTKAEAASVGSTIILDENHHHEELETILVGIASYRDFRCVQTVEVLLQRARYPQRIRIVIVDQIQTGEQDGDHPCHVPPPNEPSCTQNHQQLLCQYQRHISYYQMDASQSVGPVLARHILNRMYRGEYFVMQTDAHMEFVDGWDVDIIQQWKAAKNEMAVLSTYVSDVNDKENIDVATGTRLAQSRPYMCNSFYEKDYYDEHSAFMRHDQQPEELPVFQDQPTLQPFWAAGFSFARGHFVVQVPYDQYLPMIFQGEEPSIGIRAFTYGYDFYAPQRSVIFHYYNLKSRKPKPQSKDDETKKKEKVQLFWEHEGSFHNVAKNAMKRLSAIIDTNPNVKEWNTIEQSKYGLGKVRTTQKYFSTFGIHPNNFTVESNLCDFVHFDMHVQFTKFMTEDQMGIDYSKIDFQYKNKKTKDEYNDSQDEADNESEMK